MLGTMWGGRKRGCATEMHLFPFSSCPPSCRSHIKIITAQVKGLKYKYTLTFVHFQVLAKYKHHLHEKLKKNYTMNLELFEVAFGLE